MLHLFGQSSPIIATSNTTENSPKWWWFSKGNFLISEKSRLVKYSIWPDLFWRVNFTQGWSLLAETTHETQPWLLKIGWKMEPKCWLKKAHHVVIFRIFENPCCLTTHGSCGLLNCEGFGAGMKLLDSPTRPSKVLNMVVPWTRISIYIYSHVTYVLHV